MAKRNFNDRNEAIIDLTRQAHAGILAGTDSSRILTYGTFVFGVAAVLYGVIVFLPHEKQTAAKEGFIWLLAFAALALVIYVAFLLLEQRQRAADRGQLKFHHNKVAKEKRAEGKRQLRGSTRVRSARPAAVNEEESDPADDDGSADTDEPDEDDESAADKTPGKGGRHG